MTIKHSNTWCCWTVVLLAYFNMCAFIVCQDFQQDLIKQQVGNQQLPPQTFQPLMHPALANSRQQVNQFHHQQAPQQAPAVPQTSVTKQFAPQRPTSRIASPSIATQPASPAPAQNGAPVSASNIEILMKNALARGQSSQPSGLASEPRIDEAPVPAAVVASARTVSPAQSVTTSVTSQTAAQTTDRKERQPSGLDNPAGGESQQASEDDGSTTTQASTGNSNGHDTVYSDQRFANLFARRNHLKKSRIQPTEQVKAKPTLPSFIKSPPDPKQFTASQAVTQESRPNPVQVGNAFASQRLQQNNQQRLNLANQQRKSNPISPVSNNNNSNNRDAKKPNLGNTKQPSGSAAGLRSSAPNQKPNTPKPLSSPNNPFNSNRQQATSDPANVIAMARKRLLANSALEAAKSKQQAVKQES